MSNLAPHVELLLREKLLRQLEVLKSQIDANDELMYLKEDNEREIISTRNRISELRSTLGFVQSVRTLTQAYFEKDEGK